VPTDAGDYFSGALSIVRWQHRGRSLRSMFVNQLIRFQLTLSVARGSVCVCVVAGWSALVVCVVTSTTLSANCAQPANTTPTLCSDRFNSDCLKTTPARSVSVAPTLTPFPHFHHFYTSNTPFAVRNHHTANGVSDLMCHKRR